MRKVVATMVALVLLASLMCSRSHDAMAVAGLGPVLVPSHGYADPGDLADLALWLRADQVVSPTNGSPFSSWADLVNGGAVYTQAVGGNQFSWNASDPTLGGRPSVTSGTASWMHTIAAIPQPLTIYTVVAPTTLTADSILMSDSSDHIESGYFPGSWYAYGPSYFNSSTTPTTAAHVAAMVFNGSSSVIYIDSSASTVGAGTVTGVPTSFLNIGFQGGADGVNGTEAEFIVYSVAHTSAQVARAFVYLGARYSQGWN